MNKLISDTKIGTKIIIPLLLIAFIGLAGAVYSAWQMKSADTEYSLIISNDLVANIAMTRVTRNVQRIGYFTYKAAAEPIGSSAEREAIAELETMHRMTNERLAEADALMPEWKARIAGYRSRIDGIMAVSSQSTSLGAQGRIAESAAKNEELDTLIAALTADVQAWNDETIASNLAESGTLTARGDATILASLLVLAGAVIVSIAASLLITTHGITRPLSRLRDVMGRLADADFSVEIAGQDRKDEIGDMARTVEVFKDNGIRARHLEQESAKAREANERERAETAREQEQVVNQLAEGLARLSDGDLAFSLSERFAPDYEKLRADFNAALSKLKQTMHTVSGNTHGIRGGAGEISQAADDLSRRTEQQAASLEETAAALDEITATVRTTAENANEARRVVAETKENAEHSGAVVGQAVEAMANIEKSSQQIGQIIGVIDEIAFQTNLLALNAGVEAARAGDAGRGFAVVASEVRALAQRSAEAAKEIKTLISASSAQVDQGVSLVAETGAALKGIVDQVARINHLVGDIAASAQEQATGLQQVNTAVNQMDQVTQQNAAMVEESTAASHSLAQETEQLSQLIGQFRTGETEAPVAATRPSRPAVVRQLAPQPALKTTGYGGAARKPAAAPVADEWEEF